MTVTTHERDALVARIAQLQDELDDIDDRRAQIKGQIEKAQSDRHLTGEYADPDWFRRAKGAVRHLGVERNEVSRQIGEANRSLRALNNSLHRDTFYMAVRDVVDDVTFAHIVERHRAILSQAESGAST